MEPGDHKRFVVGFVLITAAFFMVWLLLAIAVAFVALWVGWIEFFEPEPFKNGVIALLSFLLTVATFVFCNSVLARRQGARRTPS